MSKIKITILGTAAGVPTKQRAHSAIYLSYTDAEEYCCMFDCGEGTQRQMLEAGLNLLKIDDLFVTHWHGDHCLGIPALIDTMGFESKQGPVNIYSPESGRAKKCSNFINHTMGKVKVIAHKVPSFGRKIKTLLETARFKVVSVPVKHSIPSVAYAFIEKDKVIIDHKKALELGLPAKSELYKELESGKEIMIKGRRIAFEDVKTVKKGKKVVYSGDTEICGNLCDLAESADLLIQDCTYFEKQEAKHYKHASFPEILEMVKGHNIKRTVLTHISRKYRDTDALKEIIGSGDDFVIAEDLLVVEL